MGYYFTMIDDTDDATLENVAPVYELLYEYKIFITKTVWVYPPRDKYSFGDSLQRKEYLEFIKDLCAKGFEIGIHNVGSGDYNRAEILKGIEEFKDKLGFYPKIHVNHSYNKDSIYGGYKRFNWPFNYIVKLLYPQYSSVFLGDESSSKYFWGDKHKKVIKFSRNHEFKGINTLKYDPYMPYIDPNRSEYGNYWYSTTFAPNPWVYNKVITKQNIDKLNDQNGSCILFTHLGYFVRDGVIDEGFKNSLKMMKESNAGIFLTVSELLETIADKREINGEKRYPLISRHQKMRLEYIHLLTRLQYRLFFKIDDYAFKGLERKLFVED